MPPPPPLFLKAAPLYARPFRLDCFWPGVKATVGMPLAAEKEEEEEETMEEKK